MGEPLRPSLRSPLRAVILAPRHEACQCFGPILPQRDSFFIIVFPMSIDRARAKRRRAYEPYHKADGRRTWAFT
jgi:hypothetical protein